MIKVLNRTYKICICGRALDWIKCDSNTGVCSFCDKYPSVSCCLHCEFCDSYFDLSCFTNYDKTIPHEEDHSP